MRSDDDPERDEVVAKSKESSSMKGNPVPLSDEELKTMLRKAL